MPMMNSEARKRAVSGAVMPNGSTDPRLLAHRLADQWDAEADHEDACGNGFAAVILHANARELRAALSLPISA
ncbi:hypothetical protein GCM10028801_34390 [Nocardioides maradonensis]